MSVVILIANSEELTVHLVPKSETAYASSDVRFAPQLHVAAKKVVEEWGQPVIYTTGKK